MTTRLPEIPGRYCKCNIPIPGDFERGTNPLKCEECNVALGSMDHQREAYWRFINEKVAYLQMGMGTGKSKLVIALLDGIQAMSAVIICPRRAVPVWPSEFAEHSERPWIVVAPPMQSTVAKRAAYITREVERAKALGQPWAIVINPDSAWRPGMKDVLKYYKYTRLVIDESHRIKSPAGKASKFCAELRDNAEGCIEGTGTPMPHSPLDIFAQYRALDPAIFGTNWFRFRHRYAIMEQVPGAQTGVKRVKEFKNLDELNQRWGKYAYICGKERLNLPPFRHLRHECDLESTARKYYKQLDRDFVTWVREQDDEGNLITADNAMVKVLRLQQMTGGWVKDEDGIMVQVSKAKMVLLSDLMEDYDPRHPLAVICRFHTDLNIVREVCADHGRRYGEISGRVTERNEFYGLDGKNMREDIDVVAVQVQAGGVGIDLTRVHDILLYGVGHSLGDYLQVLDRFHRPGQVHPVTYNHLLVRDTKDEDIYTALTTKQNIVDACVAQARKAR
jgi:hypothetical protein